MRRIHPFRFLRPESVPTARPEPGSPLSEISEPEAESEDCDSEETPVIVLGEDDLAELLAAGLLEDEEGSELGA